MNYQHIAASLFSTALKKNHIEHFLLVFLGFTDNLLSKLAIFVHIYTFSQANSATQTKNNLIIRLLSTLVLLWSVPTPDIVFFLLLLTAFTRSAKMADRPLVEKAFLAFMVSDGIFNPPDFPIFTNFLTSFVIYAFAGSFSPENSFKRFLMTNLVFVCTIAYFFVAYWTFIVYLVKIKLTLILFVLAKIVFGVVLINIAKRLIKTRNIVVRKYFHFLAFYLFISMIVDEVCSQAQNYDVLFYECALFGDSFGE